MTFTLPLSGYVDANSPDLQQMMIAYGVNIHIKPVSIDSYTNYYIFCGNPKLLIHKWVFDYVHVLFTELRSMLEVP